MCSWYRTLSKSLNRTCRTRFRREANSADNKAATVAMDSLINYEAVKVCLIHMYMNICSPDNWQIAFQQREIRDFAVRQAPVSVREGVPQDRYLFSVSQLWPERHFLYSSYCDDVPCRSRGYKRCVVFHRGVCSTTNALSQGR